MILCGQEVNYDFLPGMSAPIWKTKALLLVSWKAKEKNISNVWNLWEAFRDMAVATACYRWRTILFHHLQTRWECAC